MQTPVYRNLMDINAAIKGSVQELLIGIQKAAPKIVIKKLTLSVLLIDFNSVMIHQYMDCCQFYLLLYLNNRHYKTVHQHLSEAV